MNRREFVQRTVGGLAMLALAPVTKSLAEPIVAPLNGWQTIDEILILTPENACRSLVEFFRQSTSSPLLNAQCWRQMGCWQWTPSPHRELVMPAGDRLIWTVRPPCDVYVRTIGRDRAGRIILNQSSYLDSAT